MSQQTKKQNPMNGMDGEQNEVPMEGCSTEDNSSAHAENADTEPPKKKLTSDIQKLPEGLQSVLPPDCLPYAERWLRGEPVKPDELWDFVHHIRKAGGERQMNKNGGKPNEVPDQTEPPSKDSKSSTWLMKPGWPFGSSTPTVTLGFVVTGETFGAHNAIISHLKHKHLKFTMINSNKQDQCQGIIVFCPVISRAGSDVNAAMRNPAVSSSDKLLFLVLLHHTRDPEYSTAGKRCSERFPRVQGEVHVLFHETVRGLLSCALNDQATIELKQAICKNFVQS